MTEIRIVTCPHCGFRAHPAHALERCGRCSFPKTTTPPAPARTTRAP